MISTVGLCSLGNIYLGCYTIPQVTAESLVTYKTVFGVKQKNKCIPPIEGTVFFAGDDNNYFAVIEKVLTFPPLITTSGSTTFPTDLDIFSPFSDKVKPWTTKFL